MRSQPGREFPEDAIYFFALGMFQRKYLVVQLDGLLGFDKRGSPGIAFTMQDPLDLPLVLGKNSHYPPAIQERLLDIGHITRLAQFRHDPVEDAPQLIPFTEKRQPDTRQLFTRVVPDGSRFVDDLVDRGDDGFFIMRILYPPGECRISRTPFGIEPAEDALDAFGKLSDLQELFTGKTCTGDTQKLELPGQVQRMIIGEILTVLRQLFELIGLTQFQVDKITAGVNTKVLRLCPGVLRITLLRQQGLYLVELELDQG